MPKQTEPNLRAAGWALKSMPVPELAGPNGPQRVRITVAYRFEQPIRGDQNSGDLESCETLGTNCGINPQFEDYLAAAFWLASLERRDFRRAALLGWMNFFAASLSILLAVAFKVEAT